MKCKKCKTEWNGKTYTHFMGDESCQNCGHTEFEEGVKDSMMKFEICGICNHWVKSIKHLYFCKTRDSNEM